MKIALLSPGLSRAEKNARTIGVDFLARLIKDRLKSRVEFFTLDTHDLPLLSNQDADALFVSLTCIDSAMCYAKACRFKKPPLPTYLGGPGMLSPAAFRYTADAIIVGRGEEAIFKALEGDYTGMMTYSSSLPQDSVYIWPTALLSPGMSSTGCRFRCGFCSYSWAHVYASSEPRFFGAYSSGSTQGKKEISPQQELMLKDLHFNMLSRTQWHKPVVGLDILSPLDARCVKKPTSFALLRSVCRRLSEEADHAAPGLYRARMYTIAAYPWNPPELSFVELDKAFSACKLPSGVRICFDIGLSHFSPHVTTPLECCAVSGFDLREFLKSYDNTWPSSGMFWTLDKHTVPSPRQAMLNTVLMRTPSPYAIETLSRCKSWQDIACAFPREIGWLDEKPAPWLRRNNDASARVAEVSKILGRPKPRGYSEFINEPDRYNIPAYELRGHRCN